MSGTWEPILTGPEAEPFLESVAAICADLDRHPAPPLDWGRAVLHAYQFKGSNDPAHKQQALSELSRLAEQLSGDLTHAGLYNGVSGAGWAFAHVAAVIGERDDSMFEELDDVLLQSIHAKQTGHYDLIVGLAGIGVYFLERLPNTTAEHALTGIFDQLSRRAERHGRDVKWHTAPHLLPKWQRELAPAGFYNLGVAHGIPGILGLLAEAYQADYVHPLSREIGAVADWLLRQRSTDGQLVGWIHGDVGVPRERLAWCYGELGACVTALGAALALDDHALRDEAVNWALTCANRRDTQRVVDGGLCHGAFGNAHVFNRLFQATRLNAFREAALFWLNYGMRLRKPGRPLGGFEAWTSAGQINETAGWHADPSFLTGATGIGLALMAAAMPYEPDWDVTMLCRLPPLRASLDS